MSRYEMFLMGGSITLILAVLMFFSAATKDQPVQKSLAIFLLGAGLLYVADHYSGGGIDPGDIPATFIKFAAGLF